MLVDGRKAHQFAFVFLKDFENNLYFVIKYFYFKILDFLNKNFGRLRDISNENNC